MTFLADLKRFLEGRLWGNEPPPCKHAVQIQDKISGSWRCYVCGEALRFPYKTLDARAEVILQLRALSSDAKDPLYRWCGIHERPFYNHGTYSTCPDCYRGRRP